jgi:hypothetical protein
MSIRIIRPDGSEEECFDVTGEPPLKQLQSWVGGDIEVPGGFGFRHKGEVYQFVVNETGKIDGLPYNEKATAFYHQVVGGDLRFKGSMALQDELAGAVVVLTGQHLLT